MRKYYILAIIAAFVLLLISLSSIGMLIHWLFAPKFTPIPSKLLLPINGEIIKNYGDFTISFNTTLRLANYAVYSLEEESELECRGKYWKKDVGLNTYDTNVLKGIKNFARGHLVPAVDIDNTCSTYVMSNMVPMIHNGFNNGLWKSLEYYIRDNYSGFDIVTVPEYDSSNKICNSKDVCVNVPTGLYKIIVNGNKIICSLYLPHRKYDTGSKLNDYVICGKLPYMFAANAVGKCDESLRLVCK